MATERGRLPRDWWLKSALAGVIGGAAMGVFLSFVTAIVGNGFWNFFNAVGATLVRSGIPDQLKGYIWQIQSPNGIPALASFFPGQTLVGLLVHVAVSAALGIVIGWALARFRQLSMGRPGDGPLVGVIAGMTIWVVLGLLVATALNPVMMMAPPPTSWVIGHVIFGIVTVMLIRAWLPAAPTVRVTFAPAEREIPIVREQRPS